MPNSFNTKIIYGYPLPLKSAFQRLFTAHFNTIVWFIILKCFFPRLIIFAVE